MEVISLRPVNQTFRLKMEGKNYRFRMLYNIRASTWAMDISDDEGVLIAAGIALKLGTTPIKFMRKTVGDVLAYDTSNTSTEAGFTNLNDTVLFVQLTEADLG